MTRRILLPLFLFISAALLWSNDAMSCSCMAPGSPEAELKKFDAVFYGEITAMKEVMKNGYKHIKAVFSVEKRWKGPSAKKLDVITAGSSASCGFNFDPRLKYIVYGDFDGKDPGLITVTLCSRTRANPPQSEFDALDRATK